MSIVIIKGTWQTNCGLFDSEVVASFFKQAEQSVFGTTIHNRVEASFIAEKHVYPKEPYIDSHIINLKYCLDFKVPKDQTLFIASYWGTLRYEVCEPRCLL